MTDGPAVSRPRPRARQVARLRRGRRAKRGAGSFVRDLIVIIVVAVLASFLIKTFLIRSFYIPSESMENTLQDGDRILVDELVPGVIPIARGDAIVFKDPGGWLGVDENDPLVEPPLAAAGEWVLSLGGLSTRDANNHLIKRVIGLPGDHVTCCNLRGQVSVNGTPLTEPYVKLQAGETAASTTFSVTVPADSLWVMGDNRYDSKDSRFQRDTPSKGFVPMKDVVGRAFVISWPLTRWSYLSNYPATFGKVAAPSTAVSSAISK